MPRPKLLDRVRAVMRFKHLSLRTEESYIYYIKHYIKFHNFKHPEEIGADEIKAYLTHLAIDKHVAASTQNVAFSALLFLYRDVLSVDLPKIEGVMRAKLPGHLPEVFSRDEANAVIDNTTGVHHLIVTLLYGAGLRLIEALRLRVKDIDFDRNQITVRVSKGEKTSPYLFAQAILLISTLGAPFPKCTTA